MKKTPGPSLRVRLLLSAVLTMAGAIYYWWGVLHAAPHAGGDFQANWIGARAVLAGANPVNAVAQAGWAWPLYYPLPAQLVSLPFAFLPFVPAECLYVGVGVGILAFAMTKRAWWGLLVFLTPSFLHGYYHAQWSPMLVGAMLIPSIGGLLIVKPSVGLALFISRPSWRGAAGAAALVVASFIVRPTWFAEWLGAISNSPNIMAPVLRPCGFLLLLALPWWRRADARLLVALALIPHRVVFYATLPLFTIARTFRQMAMLVILSAAAAAWLLVIAAPVSGEALQLQSEWPVLLVFLYLPALAVVLRNARKPSPVAAELALEPS